MRLKKKIKVELKRAPMPSWMRFQQDVLQLLRDALRPPTAEGIHVTIDTVAGARVSGKVTRASVFGIHVTSNDHSRALAAYVPLQAIDVMDIEPTWQAEQLHQDPNEPGEDQPEPDPDLPPQDDEAAPDAAVVP